MKILIFHHTSVKIKFCYLTQEENAVREGLPDIQHKNGGSSSVFIIPWEIQSDQNQTSLFFFLSLECLSVMLNWINFYPVTWIKIASTIPCYSCKMEKSTLVFQEAMITYQLYLIESESAFIIVIIFWLNFSSIYDYSNAAFIFF